MLDKLTPAQRHLAILALAALWGLVLLVVMPLIHVPEAFAMPVMIFTTIVTLVVTKLTKQYGVGADPVEQAILEVASGNVSDSNLNVLTEAAAQAAADAIAKEPLDDHAAS